nr:glycine-rich protein 1-like [Pongo pygmaeus]
MCFLAHFVREAGPGFRGAAGGNGQRAGATASGRGQRPAGGGNGQRAKTTANGAWRGARGVLQVPGHFERLREERGGGEGAPRGQGAQQPQREGAGAGAQTVGAQAAIPGPEPGQRRAATARARLQSPGRVPRGNQRDCVATAAVGSCWTRTAAASATSRTRTTRCPSATWTERKPASATSAPTRRQSSLRTSRCAAREPPPCLRISLCCPDWSAVV